MTMHKRTIINRGLSGLTLDVSDVARTSRNGKVITLRHVWAEDTDARVWDAVHRAFMRGALMLAIRTGKAVEVYSAHGDLIEQVRS